MIRILHQDLTAAKSRNISDFSRRAKRVGREIRLALLDASQFEGARGR